jgi:(2Fe-2S) ferredoxin
MTPGSNNRPRASTVSSARALREGAIRSIRPASHNTSPSISEPSGWATLGISDRQNKIRINSAGCLDRCDDGPVLVIYPEGTWYTFVDESDLDEIIEEHLKNGRVVERLKI